MMDNDQYGLVCLSSVDDYMNDRIKKHEYTRPAKEEDRIHHMYTIGAHPGPVFLAHHHMAELAAIKNLGAHPTNRTFPLLLRMMYCMRVGQLMTIRRLRPLRHCLPRMFHKLT